MVKDSNINNLYPIYVTVIKLEIDKFIMEQIPKCRNHFKENNMTRDTFNRWLMKMSWVIPLCLVYGESHIFCNSRRNCRVLACVARVKFSLQFYAVKKFLAVGYWLCPSWNYVWDLDAKMSHKSKKSVWSPKNPNKLHCNSCMTVYAKVQKAAYWYTSLSTASHHPTFKNILVWTSSNSIYTWGISTQNIK